MLGIPRTYQAARWDCNISDTPASGSWGTVITADSTAHTKGSYAEIIASTTYDWYGFWMTIPETYVSGSDTSQLMDIAIGAAASESIIISNFVSGYSPNAGFQPYFFPLYIPRGSRISARIQAVIASDVARVVLWGNNGNSGLPGPLFTGCDTYGDDTATSSGTSVTPGISSSWGSDTNIGSTTTKNYDAILVVPTYRDVSLGSRGYVWDLRIGSVTLAQWHTMNDSSERSFGPYPPTPIRIGVPSGTQLQVRAMTNSVSYDTSTCIIYAFY